MSTKQFTLADLQAAGVEQGIIDLFNVLEPSGTIAVTPENFAKYELAQIDLYNEVVKPSIPTEAWDAFLVQDAQLQTTLANDKTAARSLNRASIIQAQLAIIPAAEDIAANISTAFNALWAQPSVVMGWGDNPDLIRGPLHDAGVAQEAAIGAYHTAVAAANATLAASIASLDAQYIVDKREAICAIIDALPDPE